LRIAYVARCDASTENGVLKKLVSQVAEWRKAGHEAELFILSRDPRTWSGARNVIGRVVRETDWLTRGLWLAGLLRAVERWKPDIVYARFDTGTSAMASMMSRVPTVLELNTVDLAEYRLYLPRYQYAYHRIVRKKTLLRAAGFVAVTAEISHQYSHFGKPTVVIANGIDLAQYETVPAVTGRKLRVVFMGAPNALWHGLDKISNLAQRLPEVQFDLIGPNRTTGWPPNVSVHGLLGRDAYQQLMEQSDAAIGTLALHRKNMDEASPLKTREYLAMGIPCIIGYRDTDFPEPVPFLLELPNTEDNAVAAASAIEKFCADWHGRRVDRASVQHLDLRHKEAGRLQFLSTFLT